MLCWASVNVTNSINQTAAPQSLRPNCAALWNVFMIAVYPCQTHNKSHTQFEGGALASLRVEPTTSARLMTNSCQPAVLEYLVYIFYDKVIYHCGATNTPLRRNAVRVVSSVPGYMAGTWDGTSHMNGAMCRRIKGYTL